MGNNATNSANCSTFDAVFAPHIHPEISDAMRVVIHAAFNASNIDEATAKQIQTLLNLGSPKAETPMSVSEAKKLTGLTAQGLNYHARKGRIRRATIPGAKRSLGYVAADIRAIVEGRAA